MLVGIVLYIVWPLTFISFLIAWLYRKDAVITTSSYNLHNVLTNYPKIKKVGKITITIALIYYIVVCSILGWEPSSLAFSYCIILFCVLILDWFLIAVTYKRKESERLFGIRIFWISLLYKISRIAYILTIVFYLLWSVKGGPYLIAVTAKDIITFLPDSTIDTIRHKVVEDQIDIFNFFKKHKLKFRVENEFKRFNNKRIYFVDSNHFFRDSYVIINYDNPEFHIYKTHFDFFKEYLYTVRGSADPNDGVFKIYHSLDRDTIYIGKKIKKSVQNYILKDYDLYIHTIKDDSHSESIEMNKL